MSPSRRHRRRCRSAAGRPPQILTDESHERLRQLIHLADGVGGPFEGFVSGAYRETLPAGSPFPTLLTWWTGPDRTRKIVEKMLTFDGLQRVTTVRWTVYDEDGTTALAHATDTIAYAGVFEVSRVRTLT